MKIDYNLTLIMYVKLLKSQKLIKTWDDGARIYYEIEKQEISPATLSNQAKKLLMSSVNLQLLFDYCELTDKLTRKIEIEEEPLKEENSDLKLTTDTIVRTLSIPKEDYKKIFDINIEMDSKELIRKKIVNKISDDVFLLNYLGFNPGQYEVQKITSGAWTTPVKVENVDGEKTVEIVLKGNPVNHDEKSSFSLFTNIYDVYNITKDPKVEVSFSYKDLRYTTCYEYGNNLIIFSHGKSPEGKNLTDKALAESIKYQFPKEYDSAKNVYVFAGHLHQDSENKFDKVTILRTASLTGVENWHYSNLYLGQRQGHTVYLIDKNKGYVGKNNITLTDDDKKKKIRSINRDKETNVFDTMTDTLNLNDENYLNEKRKKELAQIKRQITNISKKQRLVVEAIGEVLNLDMTKYTEEEISNLMNILGYQEEIKPLETKKELILKYKNKN